MIYFSVFIFFISTFMLLYGVLSIVYKDKISIENRIGQVCNINAIKNDDISNKSFSERTIKPFYNAIGYFIIKTTPHHKLAELNKKLEKAGMLKKITAEKYLYTKTMVTFIVSLIFGILIYMIGHSIFKVLVLTIIIILFINVFSRFMLSSSIEKEKS